MKKNDSKKRPLVLRAETVRLLGDRELQIAVGGASGSYCADCGTGTACPVKPKV